MNAKDLSVIVPFVNEFPQVAFTAQSILNELRGSGIDFEVIFIDNWAEEQMKAQRRVRDKSGPVMKEWEKINPEMKVITYDKKLSHWQAKNAGVAISTGKVLWFCDAHCVISSGSVVRMFNWYRDHSLFRRGSLHLPISYLMDSPGRELIYKLTGDPESTGEVHYSFTRYRPSDEPYEVPCMSTCGMMISREIYDDLGGWPEELGIYGGGENFMNFTMAVLGYKITIMTGKPIWHYAERRGYEWNFDDHLRNKMIATYIFGDYDLLKLYTEHHRGTPFQKRRIMEDVITQESINAHKAMIDKKKKVDIREWFKGWKSLTS